MLLATASFIFSLAFSSKVSCLMNLDSLHQELTVCKNHVNVPLVFSLDLSTSRHQGITNSSFQDYQ